MQKSKSKTTAKRADFTDATTCDPDRWKRARMIVGHGLRLMTVNDVARISGSGRTTANNVIHYYAMASDDLGEDASEQAVIDKAYGYHGSHLSREVFLRVVAVYHLVANCLPGEVEGLAEDLIEEAEFITNGGA